VCVWFSASIARSLALASFLLPSLCATTRSLPMNSYFALVQRKYEVCTMPHPPTSFPSSSWTVRSFPRLDYPRLRFWKPQKSQQVRMREYVYMFATSVSCARTRCHIIKTCNTHGIPQHSVSDDECNEAKHGSDPRAGGTVDVLGRARVRGYYVLFFCYWAQTFQPTVSQGRPRPCRWRRSLHE
jgi:hypothetical protein